MLAGNSWSPLPAHFSGDCTRQICSTSGTPVSHEGACVRCPPREEPRASSLAPRTARAPGGGRLGGLFSAPPPGRGSAVAAGGEEEEKGRTAPVGSGRNLGAARAAGPGGGGAAQLHCFHYSGGLH